MWIDKIATNSANSQQLHKSCLSHLAKDKSDCSKCVHLVCACMHLHQRRADFNRMLLSVQFVPFFEDTDAFGKMCPQSSSSNQIEEQYQQKPISNIFSLNVVTHDKHRPITSANSNCSKCMHQRRADFNRMLSSDQSSYVWYAAGLSQQPAIVAMLISYNSKVLAQMRQSIRC